MIGGWISLPEGVAIFPDSVSSDQLPKTNVELMLPPNLINESSQPVIIFQPDGGLLDNGSGVFPATKGLAILEGAISGSAADRQGRTNRVETILLSPYTGRARGTLRAAP